MNGLQPTHQQSGTGLFRLLGVVTPIVVGLAVLSASAVKMDLWYGALIDLDDGGVAERIEARVCLWLWGLVLPLVALNLCWMAYGVWRERAQRRER